MSEGPEVKIIAGKICKAICGKTIDKVYCKPNIGNEFANKISGSSVTCVETYGKNIVIVFSTGIYLRNHMLMWGNGGYMTDRNSKKESVKPLCEVN
ncbi:MAG: DNA-formamidopyrimidine glycosylase family protein [Nitrososphaeraceae archaeon]